MKIFSLRISLKISDTDFDIFLVEQSLDAMIKRKPARYLCIFGITILSEESSLFQYSALSSTISAKHLFALI